MKNERQERILQIIRENDVETQEELLLHLKKILTVAEDQLRERFS